MDLDRLFLFFSLESRSILPQSPASINTLIDETVPLPKYPCGERPCRLAFPAKVVSPTYNEIVPIKRTVQRKKPTPQLPLPKIPSQAEMRKHAEMWLDFYEGFLEAIEHGELTQTERLQAIKDAGEMATQAMDEFESRWPGVKLR